MEASERDVIVSEKRWIECSECPHIAVLNDRGYYVCPCGFWY